MTGQNPYVFDSIAGAYDSTRSLPDDVMAKVMERLATMLDKGGRVLDVGVGTGRFAVPMAAMGFDVVGIDLAEKMMERARNKGFDSLAMASATAMPFKDRAFGSATCVHVLHLIPDWRKALAEVSRTVRGSLFTVATEMERLHGPRAIYERRLESLGYGRAYLGMHEKELALRLKPDETASVCDHEVTLPADVYICNLERREYSWATRMPDSEHKAVIEEIRAELGGTTETVRGRIKIYRWDAARLSDVPD
jgi:2-polyprenyl-3-methyl-5-hydroxy-6-metoxy-1,4-benzoquinol methylase